MNTTNDELVSFSYVINEERCKKIEFTVDSEADSYPVEELEFTNDCGDGQTWTIMV